VRIGHEASGTIGRHAVTEVVTGEAVVLDVPCAQFPSRIGAVLIDLVIQLGLLAAILIAVFASAGAVDAATDAGIFLTAYVAVVVGYSAILETATRGRTPGKMAFGLRVISDDGGPERFRQALVRSLTGAIEIWTLAFAPVGLITSMVSAKGKRLGDMFAGTYVIQERAPRRPDLSAMFVTVPPPLLGWAQVAETSRLGDQTAEAAGSYLRRYYELNPAAREDLGRRLATAVLARVSPPPPVGTPPPAYLAAVLAVRRQRDHARLARQQPGTAYGAPAPPGTAYGGPASPWPGPASPSPRDWTAPAAPVPAAPPPAAPVPVAPASPWPAAQAVGGPAAGAEEPAAGNGGFIPPA
jgi:uncharacterized RDD family membrane protein YckC